jgi:lipopolysaccharide assembly protein A
MRIIFLMLALLLGLVIAVAALINNEVVTVNYLFGQVSLTLFMLILGSAVAGALFMGSLGIFRGIQNYMSSQGERGHKKDLQQRVKLLEDEKEKLEDELKKQQEEREETAAKAHTALENEKKHLEDELKKQQQQQNHQDAVAANANSR